MALSTLSNSKVLVTGASGFIGAAVCRFLQSLGSDVVAVGGRTLPAIEAPVTTLKLDLTDPQATTTAFLDHRPDYVIHLAGCVTGKREPEFVLPTLHGNLLGAVNVFSAAMAAGVTKTVTAGSLEEPESADAKAVPASPYAASKWAASGYARMFHALYSQAVVTARIFMVYGPDQKDLKKLVPYVCASAINGEAPKLMSGERPVDWVYVDDVAEGLARLLISGPDDGTHVDLGTGRLVTTGDVARRICEYAGGDVVPDIGAVADRQMEQVRKADPDETQRLTGWKPVVSLEDGIQKTFDWYRKNLALMDQPD